MVEGIAGLGRLVQEIPLRRALFGSSYPFFHFESALFKVQESGLDESSQKAICEDNARRLMGPAVSENLERAYEKTEDRQA